MKDHIYGFFEVDEDADNNEEVAQLWSALTECAPAQSQWKKRIPSNWVLLEEDISRLKREGRKVLQLNDVIKLGEKHEMRGDIQKEIRFFLRYDLVFVLEILLYISYPLIGTYLK